MKKIKFDAITVREGLLMKDVVFDYYNFENTTSMGDKRLTEFVHSVLKDCFDAMSYCPYQDFRGNIRIGLFEDESDVDPIFEVEFTSDPHEVMGDVDLDKIPDENVFTARFNGVIFKLEEEEPITMFGLIQVILAYKTEDGTVDRGMPNTVYGDIDEKLRRDIVEKGFFGYRSSRESD